MYKFILYSMNECEQLNVTMETHTRRTVWEDDVPVDQRVWVQRGENDGE